MSVATGDKLFGVYRPEELSDIFPFLDPSEISAICSYLELRSWSAGTTLMRDGDVGDYMGFVVHGKLVVKKETAFPGKFVLIAVLERGSMVGEISVVELGKRNATVTAAEESQLLLMTYDGMEKLLEEFPGIGNRLLKRIIHVLGYRLRMASERLSKLL
jgi:CRP-like cAMP-binding protein